MFPVAGQRTKANPSRGGICFLFSEISENKCDRDLSLPSCLALRRETLIGWTNAIIDSSHWPLAVNSKAKNHDLKMMDQAKMTERLGLSSSFLKGDTSVGALGSPFPVPQKR